MVDKHFRAGSFLDHPPHLETVVPPALDLLPGTRVGPYRLLEQIGEGGMGVVYVAEQTEPIRRAVALKLIKPGMDSEQVVARFEAERQALALMDHPHIAKVLDAGTTDAGRPFFAMELVRGIPVTDHCDQARLTVRARLELFAQVCRAVQHAHTKGVIHRDLKPSNVLVTCHDGVAVPKVIDFGVAKAVGPPLTDRTVYTAFSQMVGTPLYMSPEQAEFNELGVDTRSDVYSLGVLMYELLTGVTPFDQGRLRTAGYDELRRIIREEEPPRPSDRVNTLGAEHLSTVSARRAVDGRKLSRSLRGDLETICLKCLEKPPSRRYATAALLADDVQAYLADDPIRARPARSWERAARWVRRRPVTVAGVAVCFAAGLALAGGLRLLADASATSDELRRRADAADGQRAESEELALLGRRLGYADAVQRAAVAWRERRLADLPPLLDRDRPSAGQADVRGFEWHFLRRHADPVRLLDASRSSVHLARFMSGGKACIAADEGGTFRTWELATGRGQDRNGEQVDSVSDDDRTPGGMRAASVARSPAGGLEFKVWEVATGRTVATWANPLGHTGPLTLSPDGRLVAFAVGADRTSPLEVRLRDLASGRERVVRPAADIGVTALEFSPDATSLAIAFNQSAPAEVDLAIEVRDVATGRERFPALMGHRSFIFSLAFTPDGRTLASGGWDGLVKIWDARAGLCRHTLPNLNGTVQGVTFAPDGKQLAVATGHSEGRVGQITRADAAAGKLLLDPLRVITTARPAAGAKRRSGLAVSPDGRTVAAGGADGTLCLWDWQANPEYRVLPSPSLREAWSVAFAPDGRTLAVGYDDEKGHDQAVLQLWDVRTGRVKATLPGHGGMAFGVAFAPDGRTLASASHDRTVKLWDTEDGRPRATLEGHTDAVRCLAVSPDGRTLATGSQDRTLKLWDVATRSEKYSLPEGDDWVSYVAFAPDGATFAVPRDGRVCVHETATGKLVLSIADAERLRAFAFAPDGRTLATADMTGELGLWDVATGVARARLGGHTDEVWALAYSPDGKTLASAGKDGIVRLWQAATGRQLLAFQEIPAWVHSLAFSPDGTVLAAALHDGTVRLWPAH
ncbi:MAG: protein kinase [Gemmataceae bacterium]